MKPFIVLSALLALASASVAQPPPPPVLRPLKTAEPDPIRIAMVQSLFIDVPAPLFNMLSPAFRGMMKDFTGINGATSAGGDAFEVAKDLMEDRTHVAVLQGVEFAWVSQKYPEIKPLMLAVSKHQSLKAHLIVAEDCPAAQFADLKGKDLAIPFRPRDHLRLFVEKNSRNAGHADPKTFFSKVTKPMNSETALDDVLSGKTYAAVVDTLAWENYGEVKPGCCKRLKVLQESESFPTAVVVYRQGFLSEATLEKFRKGMVSANKSERGRDLMNMWKLTGFEAVPPNYVGDCVSLARIYLPPVPVTAVSRPVGEK